MNGAMHDVEHRFQVAIQTAMVRAGRSLEAHNRRVAVVVRSPDAVVQMKILVKVVHSE